MQAAVFRTSLFGYSKKQVNEHLARLAGEHEHAMALKNERFMEMRDQNNILKAELARYRTMEQEISSVLITARATATELIREGEKSAEEEKGRLLEEIRQLDRLAHSLYEKMEYAILQAADVARGFELELNGLMERREAFLKASYGFDRAGVGGEEKIVMESCSIGTG